jgi:hypothetical protein
MVEFLNRARSRIVLGLTLALSCSGFILCGGVAHAQGGPPYLTNDPGTPGGNAWEINLAAMPALARGSASYQIPQIDINYGVGDRIQLTYEIPYVLEHATGESSTAGWGNGYPGVKWRFLDQGDAGWQMSIFRKRSRNHVLSVVI